MPRAITVLGATGSIGRSTLDVATRHPRQFEIFALSANQRIDELVRQCVVHEPRYACVANKSRYPELKAGLTGKRLRTEIVAGPDSLEWVAEHTESDLVMAAIVGSPGLRATFAAVRAGKKVLLANKEAIVMAGSLLMREVERSGAILLPIDSEHNAVFQCMPRRFTGRLDELGVRKIVLTASGGPFRTRALETLDQVTPAEACAHPNWSMGPKISVDSATMMNKALEVIEAHWLFGAGAEQIKVLIHPQSVVHSMVEYVDGSVLAQLGEPDMRTPIAYCMAYPERMESGVSTLDLAARGTLSFEEPDLRRFPAIRMAYDVLKSGGAAATVFNAANEVAVDAFLNHRLRFTDIVLVIESTMREVMFPSSEDLQQVLIADQVARGTAAEVVKSLTR